MLKRQFNQHINFEFNEIHKPGEIFKIYNSLFGYFTVVDVIFVIAIR